MQVIELPTGQLGYWDAGAGRPVMLIHGLGTGAAVWQADLAPLTTSHRVIVYDRRGYGRSSPSSGTWETHIDDAAAVVTRLGLERPLVIGYSGGASIALALVLARPDLVGALALLDPACNVKKCLTPGFLGAQLKARIVRKLRGDRAGARVWMRFVSSYAGGGCAFDKVPEHRREALLANARGVFADAAIPDGFEVEESRLADISIPTTIIDAELSPTFLRKSCARLRRAMPQARNITIERAGHHVAFDARDELLEVLRALA